MKKLLLDQIRRKIDKAQVISFDIFDTLLVRPYVAPTDLFVHMEKAYARPGFASERRAAERRTHIRHKELEDITFDMIYEEIDAEYRDLKQQELDWEAMVLRPNPELKQVYDYALAQGKRIIIASDMYLPTEFIASILRKNGFDRWEKLYVSEAYGKKKNGSLYDVIISELGVPAKLILHIGDNERSDYSLAKAAGIRPVIIQKIGEAYMAAHEKARAFHERCNGALGASILLGMFAYRWQQKRCGEDEAFGDYWEDLGYMYTGPIAYAFCKFIQDRAINDHMDHLAFIARSGYTLKKVFDSFETGIKTSYIYSSRLIKIICYLLFHTKIEYKKLIELFCRKSSEISDKYKSLKSQDEEALKVFFEKNIELFQKVADENRENFKKYLLTHLKEHEKIALVDDSAKTFSAQFNIENALDRKLTGYYIRVLDTHFRHQYLYSAFHETVMKKAVHVSETEYSTVCWPFIEFLLSAPEGPVESITGYGVVTNKSCLSDEQYCMYQKLSDKALKFITDAKKLFQGECLFLEFPIIMNWVNSYLTHPSKTDWNAFSNISFDLYAFGTDKTSFLTRANCINYFFNAHKEGNVDVNFCWNIRRGLIWDKEKKQDMKCVRLFCIPIYRRFSYGGGVKAKILGGLVSIKKTRELKKISVLRVTVYKKEKKKGLCRTRILGIPCGGGKSRDQWEEIKRYISLQREHTDYLIKAQNVHAHFKKYWKCHTGQSVVLIAPGPTAKYYEPLHHLPHIGANGSIYMEKVKLDYLFVQDHPVNRKDARLSDLDADALKYEGNNCKKFFAILSDYRLNIIKNKVDRIPLNYADNVNIFNYYLDPICRGPIAWDISTDLFADHVGTVLSAMQFILYTNPKRIYVVGCDCSSGHMFKDEEENYSWQISGWKHLAEFARRYYPETEMISINPVGLKGLFNDVYTKSYLRKHPEINPANVAIMEEEV